MLPRILTALAFLIAASVALAGEVRLSVEEPSGVERKQWPVTSGIPFAQGALRDEQTTALLDATGREVPLQTETLVRWPDGSVRWLLVDFQIDLAAKQKGAVTLRYGGNVRRSAVEKPVRIVRQTDATVTIEPGPVRLEYDPKHFMPQGTAWLGAGKDRRITSNSDADGIALYDEKGQQFSAHGSAAHPAEFTVEQSGPIRACLRVSGEHASGDAHMFRYIARIHVWRGQPYARVFYTFINDWQDALMAKIKKLELRFGSDGNAGACLMDGKPASHGRLFQVDENHYTVDGKPAGRQSCGWAAVGSDQLGLAVGLREFRQNWPKAIDCQPGCVSLELCPELPTGLYDGKPLLEENKLYYVLRGGGYTFKVGVAKTHEFWLRYLDAKPDAKRLGTFFQAAEEPLLAVAEPAYVSSTKAAGDFPPADPQKYAGYDAWLSQTLETHLKQRQKNREYGLLNYGDWYGERGVNWGNLEYDLAHGMLVQYLRTGDRRYFLRGEQASRHHIDVDVVHAINPHLKNAWGPPPQVGEIWIHCLNHTGGYYENAPLPVEKPYQVGYSRNFGHVWTGGDFEYYCLTGDRHAREVAVEMADAMVRHCPTAYSDHIRGLGWPIVLVLGAYEATGERKYLDAATANWLVLKKKIDWKRGWVVRLAKGHCLHPERTCYGNVPFMEGLTLSALARYHRFTKDPEVLRAISVGVDQMIRECWVEDKKAFRYAACPLTSTSPSFTCLAAEGMAYEARLTGNDEHLRILRDGLREVLRKNGTGNGKSLAQMIHFAPYALTAIEEDPPKP
jgi:hypothetical protein